MSRYWTTGGGLAIGLVLLALLLIPMPGGGGGGFADAFQNALHFPLAAMVTLAWGCLLASGARWPLGWSALLAGVTFLVISIGAEQVQALVGRCASWEDVALGTAGAAWAVVLVVVRGERCSWRRRLGRLVLVVLPLSALWPATAYGCARWRAERNFPLLGGFERVLDQRVWAFNELAVRRTRHHATQGRFAVCLEVAAPAQYPGAFLVAGPHDWRAARALAADVFWSATEPREIWLRVDDDLPSPAYSQRFQATFLLQPGSNQLRVPRTDLARTSGGGPLNLAAITQCGFFFCGGHPGDMLYLDNVRLE